MIVALARFVVLVIVLITWVLQFVYEFRYLNGCCVFQFSGLLWLFVRLFCVDSLLSLVMFMLVVCLVVV